MLSSDQARDFASAVVKSQKGVLVDTSDDTFTTVLAVIRGFDFLVPGAGAAVSQVIDAVTARSATVPGPTGPLVVLGAGDVDPVQHAVSSVEQAVLANLMVRVGQVQSLVDLLGSGELRAARLGSVAVAGAFVRFLFDGVLPTAEGIVARARELAAPLGIDGVDAKLLSAIATAYIEEMIDGERPNITAAGVALKWLREHAGDAIAAPGWR